MSEQLIDFPANDGQNRRWRFTRPVGTVEARTLEDVVPALEEIERATQRGRYAVGYVAYEAGPAFDPAMRVLHASSLPLLRFELFDAVEVDVRASSAAQTGPTHEWRADTSAEEYGCAVQRIHDEIAAGRTYQVNYTIRLHSEWHDDTRLLYERIRRAQGGGYHAHLQFDDFEILCLSPELFFKRHGDTIETRPMKGTRRRGRWREEDDALAQELLDSAKDRAENLMIVDLLRNDLGRIAETGSVQVPTLFEVERYRTVHQLTSTITARVPRSTELVDIFRALFPCGSVTGAPKISTMELIAELEHAPRAVYCGAVGVVEPGGDCTFAVPIRTLLLERESHRLTYGTGSGITADSDVVAERDEVQAKAAVLETFWPEFELFETMRCENGTIVRLERHLERLFDSCAYFGFPCDASRVHAALAEHTRVGQDARVRLFVDAAGNARATSDPLPSPPATSAGGAASDPATATAPRGNRATQEAPVLVALATTPVDRRDVFLFHKTTHRTLYEQHLAAHPDVFDVLLWNREGELTEFTRGNVVLELDGNLLTPRRDSGLLAGVLRSELLDRGVITEQALTLEDLQRASRLWFINSLRGWIEVELM